MALPFFRALNPSSEYSGITYCLAENHPCQHHEMLDTTVTEAIYNAYRNDYYIISALRSTYAIIIGCHYDLNLIGRDTAAGGLKGVLDFLIFPLIARKILADSFLSENLENYNAVGELALIVAMAFEIARFILGIILTFVASLFVLVIHTIKIWSMNPNARIALADRHATLPPLQWRLRQPVAEAPIYFPEPGINAQNINHLATDIPHEYLCPLSLEIMTDPVFVTDTPIHRFERSWITYHLSHTLHNPLNRAFLNLDGIQADVCLKAEIEQYMAEQLKKDYSQTTYVS